MSTIDSNSFIYSPIMNNYKIQNNLLQVSSTSTQTDNITALSTQYNQITQGIDPESQMDPSSIPDKDTYNPTISNYSTGLTLLQGSTNTAATTTNLSDTLTSLSSQLTLLNEGINPYAQSSANNMLNYSYDPTTGVTTNSKDTVTSLLDLSA